MRIADLRTGDLVKLPGAGSALFITDLEHPLYPMLRLVIWRTPDGVTFMDALSARQDLGEVAPSTLAERQARLRAALNGES